MTEKTCIYIFNQAYITNMHKAIHIFLLSVLSMSLLPLSAQDRQSTDYEAVAAFDHIWLAGYYGLDCSMSDTTAFGGGISFPA